MNRSKLAVVFGGASSEHEVSQWSAASILRSVPQDRFDLMMLGITKDGRWFCYDGPVEGVEDGSWEHSDRLTPALISPDAGTHGVLLLEESGVRPVRLDVVFPVLHGRNGEDGTIQGLLELAGIPYVGCGVLASAVCMDKAVANALFACHGIPHCAWAAYTRAQLEADPAGIAAHLAETLGWPIFVKPANAGSSVGVTKAGSPDELARAIQVALENDRKVVFESFVDGQEVECAVIGSEPAAATRPGEILAGAEFYTYDDKYKNGVSQTVIPARLPEEKLDEVKELAARAYTALGCEGLARCDFFVERGTGRVLINEINTMPGFTSISMYPKLMEHEGTPLPQLIDRLIALAMERPVARHG